MIASESIFGLEEVTFKVIFNLIYRDQFNMAYEKLNAWSLEEIQKNTMQAQLNGVKDERIFNLMKLLRYCQEEIPFDEANKLNPGEENYHFWKKQWALFEDFIKSQTIYYESNYLGMKNYFYQKMIDNLILEFNSQSYYSPIMLETCKKLLEIGSYEKAEEGLNYLKKKTPKLLPKINFQLIKVYYYQEKKEQALCLLKDLLFTHPRTDLSDLPIPEIKKVIQALFLDGFNQREILIWLPVFLRVYEITPIFYSLESNDYKKTIIMISEWEKMNYENEEEYNAQLVNGYLYVLDQIFTRIVKGKSYLQEDLEGYLKKLKRTNSFFYQQVQHSYESR